MSDDPNALVEAPEHVLNGLEELAVAQALSFLIRRYPVAAPRVIHEMSAALLEARRPRSN